MFRLRILLLALVLFPVAQAVASLDLHVGLVEEWEVNQGGEPATLTLKWIDSTVAEGGTWIATISIP